MPQVIPFMAGALGIGVKGVGIGAALGWGTGAAFAATALGSAAIQLATSVALSALSRALMPKPAPVGMRAEQTLNGGVNPESFILGEFATSGAFLAPPMSHGALKKTPNAFLNYVIELAGIPGHQLTGLILNGERVEITDVLDPHNNYGHKIGGRFLDRAWIRFHDGTQTAADPMLLAKYPAPHVRPWSADMIGTGICYAVLTFQYDREVFHGWPQVRFELSGAPLYDPRRDSTQPGGAGPQRWGNPATWTQTRNTAVMIYNILRGIRLPSGDIWGGHVPPDDLPDAVWMRGMDVCDLPVSDGAGGAEPQFRAGFEVFVEDEPFAVIDELLKGCLGALTEQGGVWSIRVGPPGLPVMHITDDDLMSDVADDFKPFPAIDQIFNAIDGTWPDPASLWESRDADPIRNPAWEAEDGNRRLTTSVSLGAAPYGLQVARVLAALIKDHRRMRVHVVPLPPEAMVLEPLDTITWTSTANFYVAKLFEVLRTERDLLTGRVLVTLREVDPDDYDPPTGLTRPAPPDLRPLLPAEQAVPDWAVTGWRIKDADGVDRRPGIRMSWDPEAADDARGIRWAIRLAGDAGPGAEGPLHDLRPGMAEVELLPATVYEVRARIVANRPTVWSDWISVMTPAVFIGLPDLAPDIGEVLREANQWILSDVMREIGALRRALSQQVRQVRAEAMEGDARQLLAEQTLRGYIARAEFSLGARVDETDAGVKLLAAAVLELKTVIPDLATAEALQALTTVVSQQGGDISAQANQLAAMAVEIGEKAEAEAVNLLSATVTEQGGKISSLTEALILLGAMSGAGVAQAIMKMAAESSPSGVLARIGLKALVGDSSDNTRVAAIFLEALAGGESRVVVQADRFVVTDGTGIIPLFEIVGGKIYLRGDVIANGAVSRQAANLRPTLLLSTTEQTVAIITYAPAPYIYDGPALGAIRNPVVQDFSGILRVDTALAGHFEVRPQGFGGRVTPAAWQNTADWLPLVSWPAGSSGAYLSYRLRLYDGGAGDRFAVDGDFWNPGPHSDVAFTQLRMLGRTSAGSVILRAPFALSAEQISK